MKISLEPEFSGGQDIHQNSCNFKVLFSSYSPIFVRFNLFYSVEACNFSAKYDRKTSTCPITSACPITKPKEYRNFST